MSDSSRATQACPKCGRILQQSGELVVDGGAPVPVFQCDECLVTVDLMGETMDVALTFVRLVDGTLCDPADPEGKLRF